MSLARHCPHPLVKLTIRLSRSERQVPVEQHPLSTVISWILCHLPVPSVVGKPVSVDIGMYFIPLIVACGTYPSRPPQLYLKVTNWRSNPAMTAVTTRPNGSNHFPSPSTVIRQSTGAVQQAASEQTNRILPVNKHSYKGQAWESSGKVDVCGGSGGIFLFDLQAGTAARVQLNRVLWH
jgi:hypothetical protein